MARSATYSVVAAVAGLLLLGGCGSRTDPRSLPALEPQSREGDPPEVASVRYGSMVLVVQAEEGVAAIDFLDVSKSGMAVDYRYRFVPTGGGQEVRGTSRVHWKLTPMPASTRPHSAEDEGDAGTIRFTVRNYSDAGSELFVVAGPIRFEWSMADRSSGWIYYDPARLQMRVGRTSDFETLDLRRLAG